VGLTMMDDVEDSSSDCFRVETGRPVPTGPGLGNCCPDQSSRNFETWISTVAGLFYVCSGCGRSFFYDFQKKTWEKES